MMLSLKLLPIVEADWSAEILSNAILLDLPHTCNTSIEEGLYSIVTIAKSLYSMRSTDMPAHCSMWSLM